MLGYPQNKSTLIIVHLPDDTWAVTMQSKAQSNSAIGKSLHTAFAQATGRDDYSVNRMTSTLKSVIDVVEKG
jgi:hypothetical protein